MQDNYRSSLRTVDVVTIGYLLIVALIILIFGSELRGRSVYILSHLLVSSIILLLVRATNPSSNRLITFARNWYPLFLFGPLFEEIDKIATLIFPFWADRYLIVIDRVLFSGHPTVLLEKIATPWLTEYMSFAYLFYFLLIPILGGVLYAKGKEKEFQEFFLAVSLGYYLSYIMFLLIPAEGPHRTLSHLQSIPYLEGGFFKSLEDFVQNMGGIHGGAFPSSHVAAAMVTLIFSYRYERSAFYPFLPIILSLFIATVYNRYHYATDVIGGVLIGWFCTWVAVRLNSRRACTGRT